MERAGADERRPAQVIFSSHAIDTLTHVERKIVKIGVQLFECKSERKQGFDLVP